MAIMEKSGGLGAGDGCPPAGAAYQLGDGGRSEIFSTGDFISFFDDSHFALVETFVRVDAGLVFAVREQIVPVGIDAGREGRGIDVGGSGIDGVMMSEGDAVLREFPQGGGVSLGDEVGAHPVPDDYDDVAVLGFGFAMNGGRDKAGEEEGERPTPNVQRPTSNGRERHSSRENYFLANLGGTSQRSSPFIEPASNSTKATPAFGSLVCPPVN